MAERGPALAQLSPSTSDWPALSVSNLPQAGSLLTDTEKFFFDLRGYLIIRGAVAAPDVATMAAGVSTLTRRASPVLVITLSCMA